MAAFLRTASRAFSTTPARPFARINIIGNLGDAPELKASSTGREYIKYAIASNSGPRDNRTTSWFNVTNFDAEGPRRDFLLSLPKGTSVFVEGDVTNNSYVAEDGSKRTSINIVQRHIEVLRRPNQAASEESQ
ncbi:ssDNA-binding protein [Apodospora peruviana]|uniref:Single-stranded DNA-binding protein n=1 Tax=Apodospora peruviana TaxID=516989 RepID=A0AAE0ICA5_9PEZI|nr:ssDNA-binding protein [Apodospora peruviana]